MIEIKIKNTFSLEHTITSHGWVNLAPWHWDDHMGVLSRPERFVPKPSIVSVSQPKKDYIRVQIKGCRESTRSMAGMIKSIVGRWLSLDWNPCQAIRTAKRIDKNIASFIEEGGGRFLRCSTFYEDFVKTLCTVNASWSFTRCMVAYLVSDIGDGFFPTPIEVLEAGRDVLQKKTRMGYRAGILIGATEKLLSERLIEKNGKGKEENISYDRLLSLKGIGPYTASHLMLLLHDFSRIPIDSEVTKYCAENLNIEKAQIPAKFDSWGKFCFLGYKINRIISKTNWIG